MEKIVLEKLNEIAKILMGAQQRVEYLQKMFIAKLKKDRKLPGLENSSLNNIDDKE